MKYETILSYAAGTFWAVEEQKAAQIIQFLALKASGGHVRAQSSRAKPGQRQSGSVAIISLSGTLLPRISNVGSAGGMSMEMFRRKLRFVAADPGIKTLILDIDSPGGDVRGIEETAQLIREIREDVKVIGVANHMAASAAYWLASQCEELVVTPSGSVGSIGVMIYHEDLSMALEQKGVIPTLITSGKHKGEGHPAFGLSSETKAYMQKKANEIEARFVATVAQGRGVDVETVRSDFSGGRMFEAKKAVRTGMADRIATLSQVIEEEAGKQSARPRGRASARSPTRRPTLAQRRQKLKA